MFMKWSVVDGSSIINEKSNDNLNYDLIRFTHRHEHGHRKRSNHFELCQLQYIFIELNIHIFR